MSQLEFLSLIQNTMILVLELCTPVLMISVIVGLAISIFQSVTQIQESTLTFVPKIFAAILSIIVLMPWMLQVYINRVTEIFARISGAG